MARVFWPYFRDVLRWPLTFRPGPLSALVEGFARTFDNVREDILWLRDQLNPATCETDGVSGLAEGRGIVRHPLENDAQHRSRAVNAYAWHRQAGKVEGMPRHLAHFGFTGATIENMRQHDPERWAEFLVNLTPGQVTESDLDLLSWAINESKPARSKLAAVVLPLPVDNQTRLAGAGRVPLRLSGGLHYEPKVIKGTARTLGVGRVLPGICGKLASPVEIHGDISPAMIGAGRILQPIRGTYHE